MKYDDASWHYGGQFPADLPREAGATHTGMFLAWAFLSGFAGELHRKEHPDGFPALQDRTVTPGRFLLQTCDGKFTDEDLNEEGNEFTRHYFDLQNGKFVEDYGTVLGFHEDDLYRVPDTWETFDKLKPQLDRRYAEWKQSKG